MATKRYLFNDGKNACISLSMLCKDNNISFSKILNCLAENGIVRFFARDCANYRYRIMHELIEESKFADLFKYKNLSNRPVPYVNGDDNQTALQCQICVVEGDGVFYVLQLAHKLGLIEKEPTKEDCEPKKSPKKTDFYFGGNKKNYTEEEIELMKNGFVDAASAVRNCAEEIPIVYSTKKAAQFLKGNKYEAWDEKKVKFS